MTTVDDRAFLRDMEKTATQMAAGVLGEVISGGNEIRNQAMKRTPVDSGGLRAAWKVRVIRNGDGGGSVTVSNETPYAAHVEYGTKAHTIRGDKGLHNKKADKHFGNVVEHPGTQPRPMLRPAVDAVLPAMLERIKDLRK